MSQIKDFESKNNINACGIVCVINTFAASHIALKGSRPLQSLKNVLESLYRPDLLGFRVFRRPLSLDQQHRMLLYLLKNVEGGDQILISSFEDAGLIESEDAGFIEENSKFTRPIKKIDNSDLEMDDKIFRIVNVQMGTIDGDSVKMDKFGHFFVMHSISGDKVNLIDPNTPEILRVFYSTDFIDPDTGLITKKLIPAEDNDIGRTVFEPGLHYSISGYINVRVND